MTSKQTLKQIMRENEAVQATHSVFNWNFTSKLEEKKSESKKIDPQTNSCSRGVVIIV